MNTINESTGVSLKVLVSVATGIVVPLVVGFFWVAINVAEIKTTLQGMAVTQVRVAAEFLVLDRKVADHIAEDVTRWQDVERKLAIIEKSGSEKTHELEKRFNDMEVNFRVHSSKP